MKRILLIFIISFFSFYMFSQEDISKKTDGNFGKNKTHFAHSFVNISFMSPPKEGEGADIIYGKSHSFAYGIKYKYKITNIFSLGLAINYNYQTWHLKQAVSKVIPTNILYDKEKISSHNIGGEFFLRFNIGQRKNTIGNYIDIAPYGEFAYNTSRKTTTNSSNSNNPLGEEYNTTTNINLNYLENTNYGMQFKIGIDRIAFTGKYRLSNMFTNYFKSSVSSTEFPRLIIGLEIGLYE